jgi:stress response protein SCP2
MLSLVRGQKIKLSDVTNITQIQVGLAITAPSGMSFDISCFGVDAQDKLSDDRYFIFFNQKSSPNSEISCLGKQNGDMERFQIDLSRLPSSIRKLVFTVTIDGEGTMSSIKQGYLRLLDKSNELAKFTFTGADFSGEKAIIAGEIYLKDVWRFSAVGQGFNGGLSALLKHFGGQEITPPASPSSITTSKKLSLEKQLEKEAPHLVSLATTLKVSLEKKKLLDVIAKVALVLDVSGSMTSQYSRGDVQLVVNKVVPIAIHFDDDGELETWVFASKAKKLTPVTVNNIKEYVNTQWGGWKNWMNSLKPATNNEPVVMEEVVTTYKDSKLPAYVIFISDGGVGYNKQIEKILIEASKYPIFWQFVGLGGSNYGILERFDTMKGRVVDNCNFFALDDIHSISDSELYNRLLNEFPDWLKIVKQKGIIR